MQLPPRTTPSPYCSIAYDSSAIRLPSIRLHLCSGALANPSGHRERYREPCPRLFLVTKGFLVSNDYTALELSLTLCFVVIGAFPRSCRRRRSFTQNPM
ncbi:MAG: hypothetical protein LBT62_04940 [Deltaproteobacteria bacterium]|nr:hypothetical protein [Deltaproteobacteria bacterium]